MIVFIDESGDPGFKIAKGSSKGFVICCVIFDDELEAEKVVVKIKELRRRLKKSDRFEFKFNKCSGKIRVEFLKTIAGTKFRIRAIVMTKEKIYSEELKKSKESFYNFTIKMVLKHGAGTIRNARIRLDGRGNRVFRRKLLLYLRKNLNTKERKIVKNIRFRDSRKDVLIQLAGMVAGSINRSLQTEKTDAQTYLKIIKPRVGDIWVFQ